MDGGGGESEEGDIEGACTECQDRETSRSAHT